MPTEQESASLDLLKGVSIFSGLSEQEFAFLTSHLLRRKYAAGEMVFGEGDPCSGLYVVESGNVRIFKSSAGGREQVLQIDGPGSSIAEIPVFEAGNIQRRRRGGRRDPAFCQPAGISGPLIAHPQVPLKVLRVVGARLRRLVGIIEELSFTTVRHRLASYLLRLAQKAGVRAEAWKSPCPSPTRNWRPRLARSASWCPEISPACKPKEC